LFFQTFRFSEDFSGKRKLTVTLSEHQGVTGFNFLRNALNFKKIGRSVLSPNKEKSAI